VLRLEKVNKYYRVGTHSLHVLRDIEVEVADGEFVAIMGASGSGKSTMLNLIGTLDRPSDGEYLLDGEPVQHLDEYELAALRNRKIGFVFQSFNLVPTLSARENIELPSVLAGRKVDRGWFDKVVRITGLGDRLRHRPAELSGGQQQRVAVARALAARPAVVFADEPTGNLDSRAGADVLGFLRDAVDSYGQTIVMVTHDPNAASYADEVVFLADGRVVDLMPAPTTERVLERMKAFGG